MFLPYKAGEKLFTAIYAETNRRRPDGLVAGAPSERKLCGVNSCGARNVLAEVRRNVLSITCYIHTRVLAAGTAMDGETVYFLVKGIATTGTVLKRVGQRVRVESPGGSAHALPETPRHLAHSPCTRTCPCPPRPCESKWLATHA